MHWDFSFVIAPYGPLWRAQRRMFHQHFNQNAVPAYQGVQREEIHSFLLRALDAPEKAQNHVRLYVSLYLDGHQ